MKETNIATKDSDIEVVFGSYNENRDPRPDAYGAAKYLYTDLTDIRKYYIRLGFHLEEFRRCNYYYDFGYLSLEDFCEKNLGLDKSAVSRCINVFKEFNASSDVMYKSGVKTVGCAMDLSEKWKDYSYTQLCEMLSLPKIARNDISPDMTVRQIREYKKKLKEKSSEKDTVASTQPHAQPEEKKLFDYKKYDSTSGIVRQNIVKNCDPVKKDVVFNVFDKNGKLVSGNLVCDLIYADGGYYFFRLCQEKGDDEGENYIKSAGGL